MLLAIFGASAVAGVLIFAIATSTSKSSSVGPVSIWGTVDGGTFTSMIENAANTYPALSQVTYVQKDPTTYTADLTRALASGSGPDVFLISQDQAVETASEVQLFPYTSVSPTQFRDAFIQAADPFLVPTGVVALPIAADPLVLYWNKDILATAAYSQPPQYWEQLLDMVPQLTQRDDAGTIQRSAVAFGEYVNVENAKDILSALIMQAGGSLTAYDSTNRLGSAMSKSGIVASEPAAVTALRFYTQFADPSKSYYSWNRSLANSQQAFAQGNLALYIGYASELSQIQSENPNLNFAVARLPQIKNAPHTVDVARVYGLAVSHTSHNIAGAQNVVATLVSAVNSAAYATAFNLSSARRDVLSQTSTGNQSLFNAATISSYSWTDPNSAATATLFQAMIEDTTSGTILVGDAVGRADAQMTQIINNNH